MDITGSEEGTLHLGAFSSAEELTHLLAATPPDTTFRLNLPSVADIVAEFNGGALPHGLPEARPDHFQRRPTEINWLGGVYWLGWDGGGYGDGDFGGPYNFDMDAPVPSNGSNGLTRGVVEGDAAAAHSIIALVESAPHLVRLPGRIRAGEAGDGVAVVSFTPTHTGVQ